MIYLMANHSSVWKLRKNGHNMGWLLSFDAWKKPVKEGHDPMPYALDNGMYFPPDSTPHGSNRLAEFIGRVGKALAYHPPMFAVVPDMPYDWVTTVQRYNFWIKPLRELAPNWRWAIATQDGMTTPDLDRLNIAACPEKTAVCVGGSSGWKDATIRTWAKWCRERGIWCHVLRVNDTKRLQLCQDEGVQSVDGTGLFRGDFPAAQAGDVGVESERTLVATREAGEGTA